MKIRDGFVSNSSSTSFLVAVRNDLLVGATPHLLRVLGWWQDDTLDEEEMNHYIGKLNLEGVELEEWSLGWVGIPYGDDGDMTSELMNLKNIDGFEVYA